MKPNILLTLMASAAIFLPVAPAQSAPETTRFRIPFAYEVAGVSVRPGPLAIDRVGTNTICVRSGNVRRYLVVTHAVAQESSRAALHFRKYGDTWFLREIHRPDQSPTLVLPHSSREKELVKAARAAAGGKGGSAQANTLLIAAVESSTGR